jgi:aminopeptidase N
LREVVEKLDGINPQTAARLAAAFETWRRYDSGRQQLIRAELETIGSASGLSNNLYEMVSKMLAQ